MVLFCFRVEKGITNTRTFSVLDIPKHTYEWESDPFSSDLNFPTYTFGHKCEKRRIPYHPSSCILLNYIYIYFRKLFNYINRKMIEDYLLNPSLLLLFLHKINLQSEAAYVYGYMYMIISIKSTLYVYACLPWDRGQGTQIMQIIRLVAKSPKQMNMHYN